MRQIGPLVAVDRDREQRQPQVAQLGQQPIERGLVLVDPGAMMAQGVVARELGEALQGLENTAPQMVEALAKDDEKTLEDFATCADWELAGGWTTVDGERVKDDGVLEPFDVSLEEAQHMIMTARIQLGWVDPAALESEEGDEAGEDGADEEAGA